ncbi:MAG: cyclic nucleotide-binding domain-containing protein [Desulfococcaceae bacterium]
MTDPYIPVLKEMYCFKKLSENDIITIRKICREETFSPGDIIFSEEGSGDRCFILLDGQVEIRQRYRLPEEERISVCRPFQIYAETALFDTYSGNGTALAETSVRLLSICRNDFEKIAEKSPEIMFSVIRDVSDMIRKRSEGLLRQLQAGTRCLEEICLHLHKEAMLKNIQLGT